MLTGHNYIFFLSEIHTGCGFPDDGQPFPLHHTQACWYSMHKSSISVSWFCMPDVHSVSEVTRMQRTIIQNDNFHKDLPSLQIPIVLILLSSTFLPFGQEVSLAQRARSIQIFCCFQSLLKTESYLRFTISNSFLT